MRGIAEGDVVDAIFRRGRICHGPKLAIDQSRFPTAEDEYTPGQRRIIDARLDESGEDFKRAILWARSNSVR